VSGKVSSLAHYQTMLGDANYTEQQVARYNDVTEADVMRVFKQYVKGKGAAILSIVPPGQEGLVAQHDNFVLPDVSNPPELTTLDIDIMKNVSDFDRTVIPKSGMNPQIKVPNLWRHSFANGLTVLGTKNTETPTVSLLLSLDGGILLDSAEQAGLASLTANLMNEGTHVHSKEELSDELARLGSSISFGVSGRNTFIKVNTLLKNLDETIALMNEMMFKPSFAQADFDRVKNQLIQGLEQGNKDASTLAINAQRQITYGESNRLGLPSSGTIATVTALSLDDIKAFYQSYFSPVHANLVVVGDIDKKQLLTKLWPLKSWQGNNYQIQTDTNFPLVTPNKLYFVDLPDASQSVIKLSRRAMPFDATGEHFKATLMNYPLGSAFNSRINLNLREDKGYTYGASSYYVGGKTLGSFSAGASVKKEHTLDAMLEIENELKTYQQQGLTSEEVRFMRQAISQNEALSFETPVQKSGFLRQLLQYNLPINYGETQSDIIDTISLNELNKIAETELSKPMQWVIVGDAKLVKPQLKAMKLDIIDLLLAK
jgi:zinc protease